MRLRIFILPVLFIVLNSCDFRSEHTALWTIGKNKREFQKVYDNYSNPKDSLKLKAAEFLIKNIHDHYFYVLKNEEKVDNFFSSISDRISIPQDTASIRMYSRLRRSKVDELITKGLEDGSLSVPEYEVKTDLKNISAKFLIENIDYAFKAWEFPWARDYSFEDFCRYILPYRYGQEPPSAWRKPIFEKYKWIADSLENATAKEAAALLNKQFQAEFDNSKVLEKERIRLKVTNQLDVCAFTDCFDQTGLGVCVLRALGIPSAVAKIPKWGNRNNGHEMTGILDLNGKWNIFNFTSQRSGPNVPHTVKAPKIFIKQYDNMNNFEPVLVDVSGELMKTVDLEVDIKADTDDEIYLCVFDNLSWRPLFKGKNNISKAVFADVGYNESMFIAAKRTKDQLKAVSDPFLPDSLGNITYYAPDLSIKNSISLDRKYPGARRGLSRLKDLIGSEFYISNDKSFANKKVLYTIDTILKYRDNIVKVPEQTGKYARYKFSPPDGSSTMDGPAEISFYTTKNGKIEKIKGNYSGSSQVSNEQLEIMTDNDVLSYVRTGVYQENVDVSTGIYILREESESIWIDLEMDSVATITHVGICPRNDNNGVHSGMKYELFYWDDKWVSLGIKVANGTSISYENVPENAILWLRNLDEGREERIFTMVNEKQVWY